MTSIGTKNSLGDNQQPDSSLSPCILTSGCHCHYSHSTPLSCRAENSLSCWAPYLFISRQSHMKKREEQEGGLQCESVLTPERSSELKKPLMKRKAALRSCPGNKTPLLAATSPQEPHFFQGPHAQSYLQLGDKTYHAELTTLIWIFLSFLLSSGGWCLLFQ